MEVDDPPGEVAEEAHRQDPHPAGEHDEVGCCRKHGVGEPCVVVGTRLTVGAGRCVAATPTDRARSSA